jgi:hypothetical protein
MKGALIIGVCFFQILFHSCSAEQASDPVFPETEFLSVSGKTLIDSPAMRYPFRVCVSDSALYMLDLHATEYYCHVFDYPGLHYRRSLAKKGKGPGELLDAENIRLSATQKCWILDANQAQLACFSSDETNDGPDTALPLDARLIRTLDFALYADSLFIVPDYTGTHRFDILHADGTISESRGQIPLKQKDKNIPDPAYAQAWRGFVDYNAENGVLAIATQLGEVIELYDVPNDSLIRVIRGKAGAPRFQYKNGYAMPNGIMGYSAIQVGKEYIYALFWGHTFDDIIHEVVKVEGGNQIQVFDLKGNPVKQYILDRYITGFCIEEETGLLLGLDANSDQPVCVFKYTL